MRHPKDPELREISSHHENETEVSLQDHEQASRAVSNPYFSFPSIPVSSPSSPPSPSSLLSICFPSSLLNPRPVTRRIRLIILPFAEILFDETHAHIYISLIMNKPKQMDFIRDRDGVSHRRPGRPRKYPIDAVAFGGSLLSKGNPREKRPLSTRNPIHVTMKSSLAQGKRSLLNPRAAKVTQSTLAICARRSGVRIYRYQNVGNHLHLVIRLHRRWSWVQFSRSFASLLKQRLERLWRMPIARLFDHRPFTRIGTWGREYRRLTDYILKNLLDSIGVPRTSWNLQMFKAALSNNINRQTPPRKLGPLEQMSF